MHRVRRTISREVVRQTLSSGGLTPQRLHAELLERPFERLAKRGNGKLFDPQLETRMKI
jgi:hypothetical protein